MRAARLALLLLLISTRVVGAVPPVHEETEMGGSSGATSVGTTAELTAATGDLYLAAVTSKPWQAVTAVSGLELSWVRIDEQCGGRSQTGVEVWAAQGAPGADGAVTATLANPASNAAIAVSRYSGADVAPLVVSSVSSNTNGLDGACSGGTDGASYAFNLDTSVADSLVYGAAAMRHRTHEPEAGFAERSEFSQGSSGNAASVSVFDQAVPTPFTVGVNGSFGGNVDWAVIGLAIPPAGSSVPAPEITATQGSHDFGPVLLGQSVTRKVQIRNDGSLDLDVQAAVLTGSGAAAFVIESGGAPFLLAPGAASDMVVRFAPSVLGAASATLEIASDDPDEPQVDVSLSGTGVDTPPPPPPAEVTLEETQAGGSSGAPSVATHNPVSAVTDHLYLAAVASKPYQSVASVAGLGLTWIPLRAQCGGRSQSGVEVYTAWGTPNGNEAVTATLTSAPQNAAIGVARYSGVDPVAPVGSVVSGNTNGAGGACSGGVDSNAYALDLTTSTQGALVYGAANMRNRTHTPGADYVERLESVAGSGGGAASLAVEDRPVAAPATVLVDGNFSGNVDWAAIGVEVLPAGSSTPLPNISVTQSSFDFGNVGIGTSVSQPFTVRNDGTLDLSVDATSLVGVDAADFDIESGGGAFLLAPGATREVVVGFTPPSTGPRTAALRLASDDPDEDPLDVPLSGNAVDTLEPDIAVDPRNHDFGSVLVGTSRSTSIQVRNDGIANLSVQSTQLTGADAALFTLEAGAASFTLVSGASMDVTVSFNPAAEGAAAATLEIQSDDADEAQLDVSLVGAGATTSDGIWISAQQLASKPQSGPAWDAVKAAADGDLGVPEVGTYTSNHDTRTLAVALVYARTGGASYRQKARDAILAAIGTESTTTQAVQPCRNVVSYVISADLIGLASFDPALDATFRGWIDQIRFVVWPDGSMIEEDEERANNHGRMCGMSRAAIAVYLGDQVELDRTAQVFAGFLGDRATYDDFVWNRDPSWQADEANPVGVNPVGAVKQGLSIDGALPEEMRRGGPFALPPAPTGYPWEALQGILVEAVILDRAGYDVFNWSDQAILRIVQFFEQLDTLYPNDEWWAKGDDTWSPWVINAIYRTNFRTDPANIGKCMAWTDWTHAP